MSKKIILYIGSPIILLLLISFLGFQSGPVTEPKQTNLNQDETGILATTTEEEKIIPNVSPYTVTEIIKEEKNTTLIPNLYSVIKIVDGDTIDVSINGVTERLRLIGINTPETVDPRKPVECFGVEASNKAKSILTGKKVSLESDPSQGERDKYNRLLRYVFLEDETNFNLMMIKEGYAYEYTYDIPYKYQAEFKKAQQEASDGKIGLWGNICEESGETAITGTTTANNGNSCEIKGNISSTGEKIYHIIGCGSYNKTVIDESNGEKWFCSEQEALDAGWRKALNCD